MIWKKPQALIYREVGQATRGCPSGTGHAGYGRRRGAPPAQGDPRHAVIPVPMISALDEQEDLGTAGDADLCWAVQTLYGYALALPDSTERRAALQLLTVDGGDPGP